MQLEFILIFLFEFLSAKENKSREITKKKGKGGGRKKTNKLGKNKSGKNKSGKNKKDSKSKEQQKNEQLKSKNQSKNEKPQSKLLPKKSIDQQPSEIPEAPSMVLPQDLITYGMYNITMWDPLLFNPEYADVLKSVTEKKGYLKNHFVKKDKDLFGNLSLITFNAYCSENVKSTNDGLVQTVKDLLDHAHPTIFAIQGIREKPMNFIKSFLGEHYQMINTVRHGKDRITSANIYEPIIYDSKLVKPLKAGYLEEKGGGIYGSYLRLADLRKKGGFIYTIINIDLFSSFKNTVAAQISKITSDISEDQETSSHPVFLMGTIDVMPDIFQPLLVNQYDNLIEKDVHNNDTFKTTVHGNGSNNDDIQRDFIILRDTNKSFLLNYARILSSFYSSGHFPVHAILTFSE
ncbi:hypothetical protein DMUE_2983 [Dictyocoela muelleri]|nr:hypothetical protein DMUE_2983 [Dictyocoela muelleri]